MITEVIDTRGEFAIVNDTVGAPWAANISPNFQKKIEKALILYSGAWGKLIHEQNLKSKISSHYPFKAIS